MPLDVDWVPIEVYKSNLAKSVAFGLHAFGAATCEELIEKHNVVRPQEEQLWLADALDYMHVSNYRRNVDRGGGRAATRIQKYAAVLCANTVGVVNGFIVKQLKKVFVA